MSSLCIFFVHSSHDEWSKKMQPCGGSNLSTGSKSPKCIYNISKNFKVEKNGEISRYRRGRRFDDPKIRRTNGRGRQPLPFKIYLQSRSCNGVLDRFELTKITFKEINPTIWRFFDTKTLPDRQMRSRTCYGFTRRIDQYRGFFRSKRTLISIKRICPMIPKCGNIMLSRYLKNISN